MSTPEMTGIAQPERSQALNLFIGLLLLHNSARFRAVEFEHTEFGRRNP